MTDPESASDPTGRAPWMRGPLRTGEAAPSTEVVVEPPKPSYVDGVLGATPGSSNELFAARYSRTGASPIPYLVLSLAAMGGAAWALDRAELVPGATDPVRGSGWWTNTTAVLLPGEDLRLTAYSASRMWLALALLVLAAVLVALWIGRIGRNVHSGQEPFGSVLPVLTFPAWWILPITLGITDTSPRTHADVLLRYLVAFGILLSQFLLLRWPVLNRIWRAGRLPFDAASILLWLPNLIPWALLFLSTSYTYLVIGAEGVPDDSAWYPTSSMVDWSRWTSRASGVALIVLLVVVSVIQHIGMRQDRAADAARRAG
jgi:hypothetical protein